MGQWIRLWLSLLSVCMLLECVVVSSDPLPLPVVDLTGDQVIAAQRLRHAALDHGFFLVGNHSVSESLMNRMFNVLREMFALPAQVKSQYPNTQSTYGYNAFGAEKLDSMNQTIGGTKESWNIGPLGLNDYAYKPTLIPMDPPIWTDTIQEYFQAMTQLSQSLTDVIALSLGLPLSYFDSCLKTNPMSVLRLLHYQNIDSSEQKGHLGCGAHSDWGFLTALVTHGRGLQILHNGQWKDVPSERPLILVNIADELQRWTNDEYQSTQHRVITQRGHSSRASIAFFFEPSQDCVISKIPTIKGIAKYPPITHREYYEYKMRSSYPGYAGDNQVHSEL